MRIITEKLKKPCICAVTADINQGKSMLLYNLLGQLLTDYKGFSLYYYGLRKDLANGQRIFSVKEMETVQNSLVVIDELPSLFNLDDRKDKRSIENTLRLINHNNNVVVLCGVPENYKKFLAAKVDYWVFKKSTLADFINGSRAKEVVMNYRGVERGSAVLNLPKNLALFYDGLHYHFVEVPYLAEVDTKADNVQIFVPKNVPEKVD